MKPSSLHPRDITLLKLICKEYNSKQIAEKMDLSNRTVEGYRIALLRKLKKKTSIGLALYAVKHGIVKV